MHSRAIDVPANTRQTSGDFRRRPVNTTSHRAIFRTAAKIPRRRKPVVSAAPGVLAVAAQLGDALRFLAVLAAVLAVLPAPVDHALARGMCALDGVGHGNLPESGYRRFLAFARLRGGADG